MWEIERTPEFEHWLNGLPIEQARRVEAAIKRLRQFGPSLRRPRVGKINASRHRNMKELRIGKTQRVLFAFDQQQRGALLIGGDKSGKKAWYKQTIRLADRLLDDHQRSLGKGVPCRTRPGSRSATTSR